MILSIGLKLLTRLSLLLSSVSEDLTIPMLMFAHLHFVLNYSPYYFQTPPSVASSSQSLEIIERDIQCTCKTLQHLIINHFHLLIFKKQVVRDVLIHSNPPGSLFFSIPGTTYICVRDGLSQLSHDSSVFRFYFLSF